MVSKRSSNKPSINISDCAPDSYFAAWGGTGHFSPVDDEFLKSPVKLANGVVRYPKFMITTPAREPTKYDDMECREIMTDTLIKRLQILVTAIDEDLMFEEQIDGLLAAGYSIGLRKIRLTKNDPIYETLANPNHILPLSLRVQDLIRHVMRIDNVLTAMKKEGTRPDDQVFRIARSLYCERWGEAQTLLAEQLPKEHAMGRAAQAMNNAIKQKFEDGYQSSSAGDVDGECETDSDPDISMEDAPVFY
ncbi:hypothetical protein BU24DRAFT_414642 [Aaosphaeria arxii CBS 175.79]|uniref:Uncharacterized protein n=1 Tax=Aaosphaeria arxii CBS 175.79 TaxID=1450172 RepID=A0A6A5XB68_9PLEO|nr:uncharacterized protein BU24DRAFT_414642 [Aaosphaeria arxii CBS 175.79]KAF2010218.1 hypothetical protein BU24DRAFT_414642 [Aaosphaeria arxii CBS 175.79]